MQPLQIAIDGPAGAGKSTVSRTLAERLGLTYIDTGATYRAAALNVLEKGISPDDSDSVVSTVDAADIQLQPHGSSFRILLNGRDVTQLIRSPEVTLASAMVSRLPGVRSKLVELQRSLACGRGVVMEGRDIGTVVLPEAPLKVFLTAEAEERARRRLGDEKNEGRMTTLEETAYDVGRRDKLDSKRKFSPLVPAADAVQIDSTGSTAEQVVERIIEIARQRKLLDGVRPVHGSS
jgi:cytidylate kinase